MEYISTLKIGPKTIAAFVGFLVTFATFISGGVTIYNGVMHEVKDNSRAQARTDDKVEKIDEKVTILINNDTAKTVTIKETSAKIDELKSQMQYLTNLILREKVAAAARQPVPKTPTPASY